MSERSSWTLPGSIVLAGALIGAGAFFGLRAKEDPAPTSRRKELQPRIEPVAASQPRSAAPVPASSRSKVEARAKAAIEKIRPEVVKNCWRPSAAKNPQPSSIKLGFSLAFNAQGNVIGSGLIEDRENARPDMFDCVSKLAHQLNIEPPGANISVEVYSTFP